MNFQEPLPMVRSPRTLQEAYELLAEHADSIRVIAGGTDLMVLMNAHQLSDRSLLNIWALDELRGITEDPDRVRIGALCTYTQIIGSAIIRRSAPSLISASVTVGAVQIQNRGTLGGNIVNASPAGDTLPVLIAYDAELEIGSAAGTRTVPINQFYTGYRKTVLKPNELLLAIQLPKLKPNERDFFWKVGTRRAQAISKTVLAAKASLSEHMIESIAIGVGSVAPTVIRARRTEELLSRVGIGRDLIAQARAEISKDISPITDLRSTEHYRRTVTGNVLVKFLRELSSRQ
ncbi:MAG TPA: xanthine dehydrogenase family protein subunit M [Blastocatellia bacterium]|nr:xanthine dehydrogenase family protein subunit M [Blastocatellia bacterium]